MNAYAITNALFDQFGNQSSLMVPNYTPNGWYESDVYRVTKSGYSEEFEVKISAQDFRKDATKGPTTYQRRRGQILGKPTPTKHERLETKDEAGPNRFWFVIPTALLPKIEVPPWAGLMVADKHGNGRMYLRVHKKAPQLHRKPACEKVTAHARGVFYWRYWESRKKLLRLKHPETAGAT